MSLLTRRSGNVFGRSSANNLQPSPGYTVHVLKPGARASATYSGVNLPVDAGHGFSANDRLYNVGTGIIALVSSVEATTIHLVGPSFYSYSVTSGDVLLNLGLDSGLGNTPNWDDTSIPIYDDMDGTTALSPSSVTVSEEGEYGYWWSGQRAWEAVLDGSGTFQDYTLGDESNGLPSNASSTDNAVVRWDGTTGQFTQNSVVTIGDTGATTGITTLNVSGAATLGSTLGVTGNTTVGGTLGVTGASTFSGAVTAEAAGTGLAVTNNETVGGTLTVTGVTTLNGATNVAALTASGTITAQAAVLESAVGTMTGTHGQTFVRGFSEEEVTLSTSGTTSDSVGNLLPANSLILAVVGYVTTTITTATDWALGISGAGTRFASANATMTAGATSIGINQWSGTVAIAQAAAAKVRITTTGTPGAGKIRVGVFYLQFTAPTS